jgi:hypothetical protein
METSETSEPSTWKDRHGGKLVASIMLAVLVLLVALNTNC